MPPQCRRARLQHPPRRLNLAVPVELETIILKAIAKNPGDRYATAQELADDLRRFLEDKPIKARRPTLAQRARKWARRHRPLVWAMGLLGHKAGPVRPPLVNVTPQDRERLRAVLDQAGIRAAARA